MPSQSQSDFDSSGPTMIPAIPPPPGVTSNFVNPANCGRLLVVTGSVLVGIMVVFIAARAYTKTFITRKFFWDDCLFPPTPLFIKEFADVHSDLCVRGCTAPNRFQTFLSDSGLNVDWSDCISRQCCCQYVTWPSSSR